MHKCVGAYIGTLAYTNKGIATSHFSNISLISHGCISYIIYSQRATQQLWHVIFIIIQHALTYPEELSFEEIYN